MQLAEIQADRPDWPSLPWKLPIRHLSASSVKMAAECPEKFRRRYVLGEKDRGSAAQALGSAIHGTLAINFKQKIRSGTDMPQKDIDGAYAWEFDRHAKKPEIDWPDGKEPVYAKGLAVLGQYMEQVAPRIQPLAVEKEFLARVIPGLPPINGFIDLITEQGMTDYKTSSRKVTVPKGDWLSQARIYQMVRPVDFQWHILAKTATPAVYTPLEAEGLWVPYSEVAVANAKTFVSGVAWSMNYFYLVHGANHPWPTTGLTSQGACAICSYQDRCPAWKK